MRFYIFCIHVVGHTASPAARGDQPRPTVPILLALRVSVLAAGGPLYKGERFVCCRCFVVVRVCLYVRFVNRYRFAMAHVTSEDHSCTVRAAPEAARSDSYVSVRFVGVCIHLAFVGIKFRWHRKIRFVDR